MQSKRQINESKVINQSKVIKELRQLATISRQFEYDSLIKQRQKDGHKIFLPDWGKSAAGKVVVNSSPNWSYNNGTLVIKYPYDETALQEAQAFIDNIAKKMNVPWYNTGYQIEIPESLQEEPFKSQFDALDMQSSGWNLSGGKLVIHHPYQDSSLADAQNKISKELKTSLSFKKPTEQLKTSPKNYQGLNLKTLGKRGPNKAVDPIVLYVDNRRKKLKVLKIDRNSDNPKKIALPGGMLEDSVRKTCINELLEEVFSPSMFRADTKNAESLNLEDKAVISEKITELLNAQWVKDSNISFPPSLFEWNTDNENNDQYIRRILEDLDALEFQNEQGKKLTDLAKGSVQRTQFLTRMKVELYKKLLPELYKQFCYLVNADSLTGKEVVNGSDPRNTDYAWMVTTPITIPADSLFTDANKMKTGLSIIEGEGGDDAGNSRFIDVDVFCCGHDKPFADHRALLLDGMADVFQHKKIKLSPDIVDQINLIKQRMEHEIRMARVSETIELFEGILNPKVVSTTTNQSFESKSQSIPTSKAKAEDANENTDLKKLVDALLAPLNHYNSNPNPNLQDLKTALKKAIKDHPQASYSLGSYVIAFTNALITVLSLGFSPGFLDQSAATKAKMDYDQTRNKLIKQVELVTDLTKFKSRSMDPK